MSELSLKTHYSVAELLSFKLSSLPSAHKNVLEKAIRENWQSQKRKGRGGGVEYELISLPTEVQTEIRSRFAVSVVQSKPKPPAVRAEIDLSSLTNKQRHIADARMAIVAKVLELEDSGMSRIQAVKLFCRLAKSGELSPETAELVAVANAKANAKRTIGERTLNQWVIDYCKADSATERLQMIAPQVRQPVAVESLNWLPEFLAVYRNTNGLCVAEAYEEFSWRWQTAYADQPLWLELMPSLSQVRRVMSKFSKLFKAVGRKTGAELRAMNTYVKRDWSVLKANDVWVGDGHSMKMKVAHPDHGRPFIPELTMVMDTASRFIVGWSVSLAENCIAVADAIRNGVEKHGIPAVYYSDNGGGEKNWTLDADITGILPRLGINHQTGIPGNPQGRGIIERVNQTIALRIARQFETYHGRGADRETVRQVSTGVVSLEKALRQGKTELTDKQKRAKGKLPSWQQFIDAVEQAIDWYNNEHVHREVGTTPAKKRQQLLQDVEVLHISPIEARDMFRPQVIRVAQRGWLSLFNNDYFNQKLIEVDGDKVTVSFDIHNAESVIVRHLDGRFICEAQFDGNKRAAFPEAFVEKARRERANRRMKLKQEQVDEIQAELNPVRTIEHTPEFSFVTSTKAKQAKPIFLTQADKDEWEKKQRAYG
ncbi:phage transposase [Actinobacillus pleuropneumoniae]|uniref:Mu transposase C-terminal domain-containing protein n=1 Tax=Actinobacillus pleuropneumoniae TaxID=715 RepID=UPI0001E4A4BF|nr:Mu transposase C-terminal domain-containing protein [Actinobacillus pleuropneumoniae]EFM88715.1 Transposase-like Mu [Actinobacillus pleuropneumoniae serovar 4 str. M62]UKH42088.1 transposase [Actinobacillus pleuropneumoniae serovar 4 str. M62]SQF65688.1 phage transposase [Actinobacillus pleuropneumoniae]